MRSLIRILAAVTLLAALGAGCRAMAPARGPGVGSPERQIVEWLKLNQDTSSPDQKLLADIIGGDCAQTFNNALTAIAFMLAGERERAERILDVYSSAVDPANTDPRRQNFFVNGEARGFYQNMAIRDLADAKAGQGIWNGDRWMGDMAWLLLAFRQHDARYGGSRYEHIIRLLNELFVAWFVPDGVGGYIGSGWRNFDARLHEGSGHAEGNIDAYAALKMIGDEQVSDGVAAWVLPKLTGTARPLDHYTWKVLAFGPEYAGDLQLIENSPLYRKTLAFRGRQVTGFTSSPNSDQNIWCDGVGHVACAYYSIGDTARGDFYLAQMEKLVIPQDVNGRRASAIPYAATKSPGYEWVDPDIGFVSATAWYVLARHRFNPMRLPAPVPAKGAGADATAAR